MFVLPQHFPFDNVGALAAVAVLEISPLILPGYIEIHEGLHGLTTTVALAALLLLGCLIVVLHGLFLGLVIWWFFLIFIQDSLDKYAPEKLEQLRHQQGES